jgi:hypothetical protein
MFVSYSATSYTVAKYFVGHPLLLLLLLLLLNGFISPISSCSVLFLLFCYWTSSDSFVKDCRQIVLLLQMSVEFVVVKDCR